MSNSIATTTEPAILVTGGGGYIGGHTVLELLDLGRQTVVVDNFSTTPRRKLPDGVRLVDCDVADNGKIAEVLSEFQVKEIIHFAAKIVVPDSVDDPLGYYLANTAKTRTLFETAIAGGVEKIVFSSTAAVYGTPVAIPVREDASTKPLSPYGWSKLMSEQMLEDAGRAHGIRYAILRYFNVAGADPRQRFGQPLPNATHLISAAVQAAVGRRDRLIVFGTDYETRDGTGVRDYIHVSDLAAIHIAALDHLRLGGESLMVNCGYGRGYSVREVVECVKHVSGVDFAVDFGPRRRGDVAAVVADVGRLHKVLNWKPRYGDLETIVATALAWERKRIAA